MDLSLKRRDNLRPVLKTEYGPYMCSTNVQITKMLFGDDFSKALREAKQMANMGREAGTRSKNGYPPSRHPRHKHGFKKDWNQNKYKKSRKDGSGDRQ